MKMKLSEINFKEIIRMIDSIPFDDENDYLMLKLLLEYFEYNMITKKIPDKFLIKED